MTMDEKAWAEAVEISLQTAPWNVEEVGREYTETVQEIKASFEATKNPLLAWAVLQEAYLASGPTRGALSGLSVRGTPPPGAEPLHLPLPHWVMTYLYEVAVRLSGMTAGLDWRERPMKTGNFDDDLDAELAWRRNPALLPQAAKELIPAALGLVRTGWSAFDGRQREAGRFGHFLRYLEARYRGVSKAEAKETSMAEMGITDERAWNRAREKFRRENNLEAGRRQRSVRAKPTG